MFLCKVGICSALVLAAHVSAAQSFFNGGFDDGFDGWAYSSTGIASTFLSTVDIDGGGPLGFSQAAGISLRTVNPENLATASYSQELILTAGEQYTISYDWWAFFGSDEEALMQAFSIAPGYTVGISINGVTVVDAYTGDLPEMFSSIPGQLSYTFTALTSGPFQIGGVFERDSNVMGPILFVDNFSVQVGTNPVPEPFTMGLLAAGALVGFARRQRSRKLV